MRTPPTGDFFGELWGHDSLLKLVSPLFSCGTFGNGCIFLGLVGRAREDALLVVSLLVADVSVVLQSFGGRAGDPGAAGIEDLASWGFLARDGLAFLEGRGSVLFSTFVGLGGRGRVLLSNLLGQLSSTPLPPTFFKAATNLSPIGSSLLSLLLDDLLLLGSLLDCSVGVGTCPGFGSKAGLRFCGGGVLSATPGVGLLLLITGEADPGLEAPLLSLLLFIVKNKFSRSCFTLWEDTVTSEVAWGILSSCTLDIFGFDRIFVMGFGLFVISGMSEVCLLKVCLKSTPSEFDLV